MLRDSLALSPVKTTIALGLKFWATYSSPATEGILEYARRHNGYDFRDLIWSEAEQLPQMLRRVQPAGAIVSLSSLEYATIREQLPVDLPLVSIGADTLNAGVGVVCSDDQSMMKLAVEHLRGAGYRRLGFVGWEDSVGSKRRVALLRRMSRSATLFNVRLNGPTEDLDAPMIDALGDFVRSLRTPVGIIAWSGSIAAHVLRTCQSSGLRVPQDVGILSLADDSLCLCGEPAISSMNVDGEQLGARAMMMLVAMLRGERAPRQPVMVPPIAVIARQSTTLPTPADDLVKAALHFIDENALRGIVVKNVLATLPGVGRTRFYADFTTRVGCSPADYIRRRKLARAQELLTTTSLSITRIATMCGFASTTQFGDTFKREVGVTPLAFRRQG